MLEVFVSMFAGVHVSRSPLASALQVMSVAAGFLVAGFGGGDGVGVRCFGAEPEGVFDEVGEGVGVGVGGLGRVGGVGEFRGVEVREAPGVEGFVIEGDGGVLGGITDQREVRGDGDGEAPRALGKRV